MQLCKPDPSLLFSSLTLLFSSVAAQRLGQQQCEIAGVIAVAPLLGVIELNQGCWLRWRDFAQCRSKKLRQMGFQIQGLIDSEQRGVIIPRSLALMLERVERTLHATPAAIHHIGVNHSSAHVGMPQ